MNHRDVISARYFNQQDIVLDVAENIDLALFGLKDDTAMLARLAGAPDGSIVELSRLDGIDAISLSVKHPGIFKFPSYYALFNEGKDLGLSIEVDSMYVREELQGKGIGTRSVLLTLKEAKALGFKRVFLDAAGSAERRTTFFGYHVWPSLGFDAPLPTEIKRRLPADLAKAEQLSDLMRNEDGVQWWYDHGCAMNLEFDLCEESVSWQLCRKYADEKGIR